MYGAVGARNCLHRYKIPLGSGGADSTGVGIYLYYESLLKTSMIADFFNKHTRIMIPLLGLLFAAVTYLVFDPIREFNVINHITKRFTLQSIESQYSNSRLVRWFNTKYHQFRSSKFLSNMIGNHTNDQSNIEIVWSGRKLDEEKVIKWLHSVPDRILFLTGPKGTGKSALIDKAVKDKSNVIRIEFDKLLDRNDDEFVKGFSSALGFRPGFAFLTIVSQLLDVITPGASKATGSQSQFGSQINKVLEVTAGALVEIAKKYQSRDVEVKHAMSATSSATLAKITSSGKLIHIDTNTTATIARKNNENRSDVDNNYNDNESNVKPISTMKPTETDGLDGAVDHKIAHGDNSVTPAPKPAESISGEINNDIKVDNDTDTTKKNEDNIITNMTNTVTGLFTSHYNNIQSTAHDNSNDTQVHVDDSDSDEHTDHLPKQSTQSFWNRLLGNDDDSYNQHKNISHHVKQSGKSLKHDDDDYYEDSESSQMDNHMNNHSEQDNDDIPLFIIDGFNSDNKDKHNNFVILFTAWADSITKLGLARFLYMSDSTIEEHISKSLPDARLTEVMLADASKENAIEFVQSSMRRIREADKQQDTQQQNKLYRRNKVAQLINGSKQTQSVVQSDNKQKQNQQQSISPPQTQQSTNSTTSAPTDITAAATDTPPPTTATVSDDIDDLSDDERDAHELAEIKQAIDIVGGRYNDLQTLVRGLESGSTPRSTVEDMLSVAINSVRSVLFNEDKNNKFTKVQLWLTMNKLVNSPRNQLLYDDLLFNIFKGDDTALRQLVRHDLLRIEQQVHSNDTIKAGSGIQLEAYKRMIQQDKLRAGFDLAVAKSMLSDEQKKIDSYEDELNKLTKIMHNELDMRKYLALDERKVFHNDVPSSVSGEIVAAAVAKRRIDLLRLLNDSVDKYTDWDIKRRHAEQEIKKNVQLNKNKH